jgi:hypothetical protein
MVQGLSDLLVLDEASIKRIETEKFPSQMKRIHIEFLGRLVEVRFARTADN